MMEDRGGQTLKSGKIGHVNCIRQQFLMPGETVDISMKGTVKLESLRERDSLRINAHLGIFMTPMRWLWEDWPQYLKDGPSGSLTMPTISGVALDLLGIGARSPVNITVPAFWGNAYRRVYNEWYKWPELPDAVFPVNNDGEVAVPLQHVWNRGREDTTPDSVDDYTLASGTDFDIRDLAALQSRFTSSMERDVLSYNRYMELVSEMYNANGSREVDQVPMMVDQTSVGVNPRDMPATDGASLGQWQSLFDFDIDHQVKNVVCPEHCVITYMLTVRFAPVIEGRAPFSKVHPYAEMVGDAEMLRSMAPVEILEDDVVASAGTGSLGFVPAGWQWRAGHDVIGSRVDVRDSFPYMDNPSTFANSKDASRIKPAFRSQSLGDYMADIYISERTRSPINSALESYFSGLTGSGSKAEFPKQGKML